MVDFLLSHPRCFNLSDMGTQKTLAALWAADRLMQDLPNTKCLVICPLSTMELVWADSIRYDFMGRRTFSILHGSVAQRMKALESNVDFYILNHDGLAIGAVKNEQNKLVATGFTKAIKDREDIRIIIYDEVSALKHATTDRSRTAYGILGGRDYVWAMTATPAAQAPTDAYGVAKLINGRSAAFPSFYAFRNRTMHQPAYSQFKWLPNHGAEQHVAKLLEPSIRFSADECNDIPPMSVQQRQVELSEEQQKALQELQKDLQATLDSGVKISAINEAAFRTKLLQLVCGAVYDDKHGDHKLDCRPRLRVLEEVIEGCGQKVIVFAPFTSVVSMLYDHLRYKYATAMVTGATSPNERAKIFRGFQGGDAPRIIVADAGTMSHGLDLTRSTLIIWYSPIDKAETYQQANARIHRPAQSYPTTVVQLTSTKLEREIFHCRAENISMQGSVLKLLES